MKPLLARDLMTVGVPTCKTSTPLRDVARFLIEHNVEEMVVLDEEGHGVGVVGHEQIVARVGAEGAGDLVAEDIMSESVTELPADLPIPAAAQDMIPISAAKGIGLDRLLSAVADALVMSRG